MRYPVILADPPVPFLGWSGGSGTAASHYPLMTWQDLEALGPAIQAVAADDCLLLLWICQPLLLETIAMAQAWGFAYKTKAFSWVKTCRRSTGTIHTGMGYWTRSNTEDVLAFTRGAPHRQHKGVSQIVSTAYDVPTVVAPLGRHSEKPELIQDQIEQLMAGPYLELFARRQRPGWTCAGNELSGLDIQDELRLIAASHDVPRSTRHGTASAQLALVEVVA